MPGLSPQIPEAVTYEQYEDLRDDPLPPTSIHEGQPYTFRWRDRQPTQERYAHDYLTLAYDVEHLDRYSIVRAKIQDLNRMILASLGVNTEGLVFNPNNMPIDVGSIQYKEELGYFVGEAGDIFGGEVSARQSEEIRSVEELVGRAVLVGSRS